MEDNKGNSDIYTIGTDGKNAKAIFSTEKNETKPKFTPDGKISYIFDKQIWISDVDGKNSKKTTNREGKHHYLLMLR